MSKPIGFLIAAIACSLVSSTFAQDAAGGKERRRPPGNPPPQQANNQVAGQNGRPASGQPTFDANAWSTMMLQQFDADGDAKLDQAELAQCLATLAQMVQTQAQVQQQGGAGFRGGPPMPGSGWGGPPGPPPDEVEESGNSSNFRQRGGPGGGRGGRGGPAGGQGGGQLRGGNAQRGG